MIFTETKLSGVFLIELERLEDVRGFFALTWSAEEFARRSLVSQLAECNISLNNRKGTLRGMHYQAHPHSQTKLVRCTMGAIYDVVIDLRAPSPTFKQWLGVELSANNHRMIYIPKGFAHGFQTLEDHSEVLYQMSYPYVPASSRGVRWDDPAFGIHWPDGDRIIIERDRAYPDFNQEEAR
jgi:dTDP-4-dehydrorhamnose 3,5-epimerase